VRKRCAVWQWSNAPHSATRPRLLKAPDHTASAFENLMSQVSVNPNPIPATGPFTAAMIGFLMNCGSKKLRVSGPRGAAAPSLLLPLLIWFKPLRSAPAQKPRPAPCSVTGKRPCEIGLG
jgi:hypothetical protein